jgi:hypothetical protein
MAAPFKNSNFGCFSAMDRLILQFVTWTLFMTSGLILLIYFVLATQVPVCEVDWDSSAFDCGFFSFHLIQAFKFWAGGHSGSLRCLEAIRWL